MSFLLHESLMRGREALKKFEKINIVICGVGAIGSNLAEMLVRQGFNKLTLIDFDRIEEHNIGTQAYYQDAIGMKKVDALFNQLYRISRSLSVTSIDKRIDIMNIKRLLKEADLVIDSLDRSEAREVITQYCKMQDKDCVHLGVAEEYSEIVWNEQYRIPKDRGEDQCNYPLSRSTIMLAVVIASESIVRYTLTGEKKSYFATTKDFCIESMNL